MDGLELLGEAVLGGDLVALNLVPSAVTCLLRALVEVISLLIAAKAGVDSRTEGVQGLTRDSGLSSESSSSFVAAPRKRKYQALVLLHPCPGQKHSELKP